MDTVEEVLQRCGVVSGYSTGGAVYRGLKRSRGLDTDQGSDGDGPLSSRWASGSSGSLPGPGTPHSGTARSPPWSPAGPGRRWGHPHLCNTEQGSAVSQSQGKTGQTDYRPDRRDTHSC